MADAVRFPNLVSPLLATLLAAAPAHAQIVTDGTLGPRVSLSGSTVDIGAQLGTQRGGNLFHSFEKFGIATGQTATFTGPDTVKNVISRVTGGEISHIDGTLASKVGQADLYFLNPAGVVFGPNAKLDVPGSFHVSTAHEMRFADGARFSTLDRTGSGLTTAAPEAFGFLDQPRGRIAVDQSQLQLQAGKTLSLVGGDIDIAGGSSGRVSIQGGTVHLASLASSGHMRISDATVQAASQGTIHLTTQTRIDTSGNGAGTVRIRGGALLMEDSSIDANNISKQASTGGIDVQTSFLEMHNSSITSEARGSGKGGAIAIQAGTLMLDNGTKIASNSYGKGDGGSLTTKAGNLFVLGTGSIGSTSIESNADAGATGTAGTISISADQMTLRNGGTIRSQTFGAGNTGAISVHSKEIFLYGDDVRSRIVSETFPGSTGTAGPVAITAGTVELHNGGQIFSRTGAQGAAGAVSINTDMLMAFGGGVDLVTGVLSETSAGSTGPAGPVTVAAHNIELRGGGQIVSTTRGNGSAGTVTVKTDQLLISRDNAPRFTGIAGNAEEGSIGAAGAVNVTAKHIELSDQGRISSDSHSDHTAGTVTVRAPGGLVVLSNGAFISSDTYAGGAGGDIRVEAGRLLIQGNNGQSYTGIGSDAIEGSTGAAGAVSVIANDLQIRDGGTISSDTSGNGNAGAIEVTAGRLLVFGNGDIWSQISSRSFPDASGTGGAGGSIDIHADTVILSNSGYIITQSNTPKRAGDITIEAHDSLEINNPVPFVRTVVDGTPTIENTSGVFSSAKFGTRAGDIQISAGNRLTLNNGYITSFATRGEGGRITVKAGHLIDARDSVFESSVLGGQLGSDAGDISTDSTFLILDNSHIKANAVGGNGGNVRIIADTIIQSPSSSIEATSERAISGTIEITAPDTDIASSLVVLPETFLDASSQLREACANQGGRPTSSLVVGGQGGLPHDPARPLSAGLSDLSSERRADQVPNHAATLPLGLSPEASSMVGMPYPVLGAPRIPCRK